jgi:ABC-type multidrug transport system ATPase subunit
MGKREIDKKFDAIVDFADIGDFLDTPVKFYSSGMFVRLGFAVAVHCEPEILLVDEVLAVGDEGFQNKCFNKIGELRNKGTTSILVSHNMHIVSGFAQKVILLHNGKFKCFDNVAEGIHEYRNLFVDKEYSDIERICSGTENIEFFDIVIGAREFHPGDSFVIAMKYRALIDYHEVEIDTVILCSNEPTHYFQATNKAYNKRVDLKKGEHTLRIRIDDIQINNARAKVVIAIWSKNRGGYLFWWRIPVEFKGVDYSTGNNFLNVSYEVN